MPSGPKKRRASKRKKGANGRFIDPTTGEEETQVEFHEGVNNEREISFGDEKAGQAVDEMGSKESQSVDTQMDLKENVKESEDVPVLDKSEYVDRSFLQAPLNGPISTNPEENERGEVVESASQGSPVVMNEGEENSMDGVLEERLEEPIGRSSDVVQEMVKTVDQSILPSEVGQDFSVSKKNVETSLKDAQDYVVDVFPVEDVVQRNKFAEVGESEQRGPPRIVNEVVSVLQDGEEMSTEGVLKSSFEEPTESSSHELAIPMKETHDSLDESVLEVDVETISFEDAPDSFETPLGSPTMAGYMSHVEGDGHWINGYWNQPIQRSLSAKAISLSKVQDLSLPAESVNEVEAQISSEDPQYSFKELAGSSSVVDVFHVQENECAEVGENACQDESVLKEAGQMSMEGVLVDPFEEPIGRSLYELQAMVKMIDNSAIDDVSSMDHDVQAMVNHVKSVMKKDKEMSLKDVLEEPQTMVKMDDQSVLKGLHFKEAQDPSLPADSAIEMNVDTSLDEQDSSNKPLVSPSLTELTFVSDNVHINGYGLEQIECFSHEPQEMYKTADLVVLKKIPLEVQDDSIVDKSVIGAHIETPFKDDQDSLKRQVGDSSIDDVCSMDHGQQEMVNDVESTIKEDEGSPIEDALEETFKEPSVGSLYESQSIVNTVDQDPSVQAESVIEVNLDTSFEVPLGLISSLDDVFPVEGFVQENKCIEVDESACHGPRAMVNHDESEIKEDDDMSMEVVLEETTGRSLNEPKDVQDSFNWPLGSSSLVNVFHIEGIVNHVMSTMKEDEELSIKTGDRSVLNVIPIRESQDSSVPDNESVIELNVASKDGQDSYEPHAMVKTVDQPVKDSSVPNESVIEVNLETSFRESQDHFKKPMGSSSQVNGSRVEGVGQRDDMVGLAKTLLEEIRRIRAFYEEGLRQTTEIHFHICRVLEKFDSGELI